MGRSGISTFDLLGDIPPEQRTLMRLFLRRIKMTQAEITQAVAELPAEKQLTGEQTQAALAGLIQSGWIERKDESGNETYIIRQQSK